MNHQETLELLSEAINYCEKLYSGMVSMVKNIDDRNLNQIEEYFKNILEGFNWILEIGVFTSTRCGEELNLQEIHGKLNKYIDGYNNLDLLFVRDVVEYELMPQVEVFYNIFNKGLNTLN